MIRRREFMVNDSERLYLLETVPNPRVSALN